MFRGSKQCMSYIRTQAGNRPLTSSTLVLKHILPSLLAPFKHSRVSMSSILLLDTDLRPQPRGLQSLTTARTGSARWAVSRHPPLPNIEPLLSESQLGIRPEAPTKQYIIGTSQSYSSADARKLEVDNRKISRALTEGSRNGLQGWDGRNGRDGMGGQAEYACCTRLRKDSGDVFAYFSPTKKIFGEEGLGRLNRDPTSSGGMLRSSKPGARKSRTSRPMASKKGRFHAAGSQSEVSQASPLRRRSSHHLGVGSRVEPLRFNAASKSEAKPPQCGTARTPRRS
ncbi:hypothetical protein FA13DRAFT_1715899 [Coprinellus micaceus]|uniref:Uncharacterized protein n=1 Tax=Coprinellus micaceus TaxID=71717 RepID=A0A4Y7SLF1_COPMI|nr:hypothetical protein FA13DRAFT_1715899 [Coprinellus micaceus]